MDTIIMQRAGDYIAMIPDPHPYPVYVDIGRMGPGVHCDQKSPRVAATTGSMTENTRTVQ